MTASAFMRPIGFSVPTENAMRSVPRAEPAHRIDDQTDQQDQTKPSSADCRATEVKTATAEQYK